MLHGEDRHFVAIPAIGLAYGRIPKAANSMLKRQIARAAGIEALFPNGYSKDRDWAAAAPHAYLVSAAELRRRWPDMFVFTFVREPMSRLASCYRSKVERKGRPPKRRPLEGMGPETPFDAFVEHVARRPDRRANVHYRGQASMLAPGGRLAPDFVGRFETLREDWARLQEALAARGGPALPALPPRRRALPIADPGEYFRGDGRLVDLARRRFADDYRTFYRDA
ncbi:MAG: sulfotransferase family 2 domain-containing protein [Pseudomonadota bacterium]